jgi:hypothetical protein
MRISLCLEKHQGWCIPRSWKRNRQNQSLSWNIICLNKRLPVPSLILKLANTQAWLKLEELMALLRELVTSVCALGQLDEPPSQIESRMEANVSAPSRRLYYVNTSMV